VSRTRKLTVVVGVIIAFFASGAPGANATDGPEALAIEASIDPPGEETAGKPIIVDAPQVLDSDKLRTARAALPDQTCSEPDADGVWSCVTIDPNGVAELPPATGRSIVAVPAECSKATGGKWVAWRTSACYVAPTSYTVQQLSATGVPTIVGTASLTVIGFAYTDAKSKNIGNQIEIFVNTATGKAIGSTVNLTPSCSGACTLSSKLLSPVPLKAGARIKGESYFTTTVSAAGQIGNATPKWAWNFSVVGGTTSGTATVSTPPVRCDNALGNGNVGCVIPGGTMQIIYSKAIYPLYASHVTRAQASGLPGGTVSKPLHRLQAKAAIDKNRAKLCPSGPAYLKRPVGYECDEYPFASTKEGAALSGGGARTHSGCQITLPSAPSTGAIGYSEAYACWWCEWRPVL
jgi:hypothetical protein